MTAYVDQLAEWFRKHGDKTKAIPMENYMRNQYPFLGIKSPERTALTKTFWAEHGIPAGEELLDVVRQLWLLPEREFQNVGMAYLEKYAKKAKPADIDAFEELVTTKSWWDTVDYLASHTMGDHLTKYPELIPEYTERWIRSDNMWLRRTAILYQLRYKQRTDVERLFEYLLLCKDENEFFIRKAIGWALREYAKTDAEAVRRFVAGNRLSPLSEREALKGIGKS
ncbi:DNA alkylation repair protein [Cohnella endophytica]|uniref:DNA alkylation repair protein n=2 Tax=Cohnella endophytica TaxID=2419778 RepID=A0A494Y5P8_9BACL|nr:DNA alkylation repair protein [Cohnella endophytica]